MSLPGTLRVMLYISISAGSLLGGTSPSTISLTSSAAQVTFGRAISFTATVSPLDASGRVEFLDGSSVLGSATLHNGTALLVVSALSSGSHKVLARYSGDDLYSGSVSGGVVVTVISATSLGLGSPASFNASASGVALASGDFDRDGRADLAITNSTGVNILLGNGDGTFKQPVAYGTVGSTAISVQDVDGDGLVDLVVGNVDKSVTVYRGNGDGTFQPSASTPTSDVPAVITVADLNGDGTADLVVSYGIFVTGGVDVLLGNPDGSFQAAQSVAQYSGSQIEVVAVGDFNGDGAPDLIVFRDGPSELLIGNGDGTFQPSAPFTAPGNAFTANVVDLNGDGILDLVVGTGGGGEAVPGVWPPEALDIYVMLGLGNAVFASPVSYPTTGDFAQVLADFNGDGKLDLAVADTVSGAANVLLGNGDGSFGPVTYYQLPVTLASSPVAADFNGDGIVDLGLASKGCCSNLAIFLGQAPPPTQVLDDVSPTAYYYGAVIDLYQHGVTEGCSPDHFCPDDVIPRWQAAVFLVRSIIGSDAFTASPTPYFADVPANSLGFTWIQKLYELGITTGCGVDPNANLLFCPDSALTRAEAAVLVVRSRYGATTPFTWPTVPYFTDVPVSAFGYAWIQRLKEDAITSGCGPTLFCPDNPTTRADMAVFLVRADFNQLLPLTQPVISSVSPSTLTQGTATTIYITGLGTHFLQGSTTLVFPAAAMITLNSITVESPTYLVVNLSAGSGAAAQPNSIYVQTGAEEAVLPNSLHVQNIAVH